MTRIAISVLLCVLSLLALAATGCNTTSEERIAIAEKAVEVAEERYEQASAALEAIEAAIDTLQARLAESEVGGEQWAKISAKIDELQDSEERKELIRWQGFAKTTLADARDDLAQAKQDPSVAAEMDVAGGIAGGLSSVGGPVGAGFAGLSAVLGVVAEYLRRRKKEDDEALGEAAETADLSKLSPKAKKAVRKATGKQI